MVGTMTVEVTGMRIFARHGLHDEEALTGNEFEISASVTYPSTEKVDSIAQTVDYVKITDLIKNRMAERSVLLETVAQDIAASIKNHFPFVTGVKVSLIKLTPPLANFRGAVGVSYTSS